MEDKTPNPSEEDVKTDNPGNDKKETFEVSKEEFEKLQELQQNKTIALDKERDKSKNLSEELATYKAKEKKAIEEKQKKEGKYEELLAEKTKENETLNEKANAYDKLMSEIQEKETNQLNDLMTKVDDEVLEKNSFILDDLSTNDKKIKFLENLLPQKQEKKDFENKGKGKNPGNGDEFESLKEKISNGKATPSERGEYLRLLRTKT